ncbi:Imm10 family immunity protein [Isoptericola sediminis]|uniref:Imm10 family immunity protein n=1 Tax=Isoptericola sediminis TaxID=2733572 RepID=UPI001C087DF0
MRLKARNVGFFEDYDDEEALEVAFAGEDEGGCERSFSIQRSTYPPDAQEIRSGMDSYCVSTERGLTVYGCLLDVSLVGHLLRLQLRGDDADALEVSSVVEVDLGDTGVDTAELSARLREILVWGSYERRPGVRHLGESDVPADPAGRGAGRLLR